MHKVTLKLAFILTVTTFVFTGCSFFEAAPSKESATVIPETPPTQPLVHLETTRGIASYYAGKFHGRRTANGERFSQENLTAAHPTLPFGTRVGVRNLKNNAYVEVRINDRGPFKRGRIIDLSKKAATQLGFISAGLCEVELTVVGGP